MKQSLFRQIINRVLHLFARFLPGATGFRPWLHRLRGVTIGKGVFIGDEVYLENEHPEAVEIQSGAQISVRVVILAHTRGSGKVIIEKDVFIGPNAVIAASGNRTLRIGEGAVIGAGVVLTQNVSAHTFVSVAPAAPVANVRVPLTKAETMEDFVRGLAPIGRRTKTGTSAAAAANSTTRPGRG